MSALKRKANEDLSFSEKMEKVVERSPDLFKALATDDKKNISNNTD